MTAPKVMTYAGLKLGMRVEAEGKLGTIIDKDNAAKQVKVLFDHGADTRMVSTLDVLVLPVDPLDQINPMCAKNAEQFSYATVPYLVQNTDWAMEEKYDGERQILRWCPERGFQATTRVVGKNTGRLGANTGKLVHLDLRPVARTTVLDVEVFHDDGFPRLRSIMGSDDEKANARQAEWGYVYAIAFDCLWYEGEDLRGAQFGTRRAALEELLSTPSQYLKLSPLARTRAEKEQLMGYVAAKGGEGVMAKRWTGVYTDTKLPNRRSADILKVKPFSEADVIVTGFMAGEGKYNQDKLGAIKVAQWVPNALITKDMTLLKEMYPSNPLFGFVDGHTLVSMGTCSGFSNKQEAAFRANPDAFIGKPIELKYQQRWPETGLFRHPNFLRLRHDKAAEQCIYETGED